MNTGMSVQKVKVGDKDFYNLSAFNEMIGIQDNNPGEYFLKMFPEDYGKDYITYELAIENGRMIKVLFITIQLLIQYNNENLTQVGTQIIVNILRDEISSLRVIEQENTYLRNTLERSKSLIEFLQEQVDKTNSAIMSKFGDFKTLYPNIKLYKNPEDEITDRIINMI